MIWPTPISHDHLVDAGCGGEKETVLAPFSGTDGKISREPESPPKLESHDGGMAFRRLKSKE
jgi:hypothetical protein